MKLMLPIIALFAAAPAFASAPHCPPGYLNVWGACVLPTNPGIFDGDAYDMDRGYNHGRYHRGHRGHRHGHGHGYWR